MWGGEGEGGKWKGGGGGEKGGGRGGNGLSTTEIN